MDSRAEQAVKAFESGYTCAQSVFASYADLFGMDRETALKLSSPMGGGIGRMREVCGAVSAMAMLAGLKEGNTDPANEEGKEKIYLLTRRMAGEFKNQFGTIVCRELLGIEEMEESAKPSIRTVQYYQERPCLQLISAAARIVEEMLLDGKWE